MSAIKGAGAIINIGAATSGSAIAITAATKAAPPVLTTAANTFANGDIGVITGVVGMVQLNNRAFVMNPVTGTSATLPGVDASQANYGAYVSGGTIQKYTMEAIGNVTSIKGLDGQAKEIDVTNLGSGAEEIILGLQSFGTVTLDLLLTPADVGQIQLQAIKEQQVAWPFSIILSSGAECAFMAFVKQFGVDGIKPDGAITVPCILRVTNAATRFA